MYQVRFFFAEEEENKRKNTTYVNRDAKYSQIRKYGFVTKSLIDSDELLKIPAINSGFIPKEMETDRLSPVMFKTAVPHQGNYKVEIVARNNGKDALFFLERRRLYYIGNFEGEKKFTFSVNVCDIIPENMGRIYADSDLDISWIGEGLEVISIDVKENDCPTLYIAGDSTVTDQPADYPYSPGTSYSGWGQMLSCYLSERIAVSNHAHSGLTTDSFRKEGHYSIITQYIRPGDYMFLQFGHNDQKIDELREDTGYRANLERYIDEVRAQGAYPVIVTPLARNTWRESGKEYNDLLEKYALECIKIGKEKEVPVLDLHKLSMEEYIKNGLEESMKYFFPGDLTHTNDYGAHLMAGFVAGEIKKLKDDFKDTPYSLLGEYVYEETCTWEVDKEMLKLPKLVGKEDSPADEPYALKMDRLEEIIRRK